MADVANRGGLRFDNLADDGAAAFFAGKGVELALFFGGGLALPVPLFLAGDETSGDGVERDTAPRLFEPFLKVGIADQRFVCASHVASLPDLRPLD